MPTASHTRFAPAARATEEQVSRAHQGLAGDGVLAKSLDALPEVVLILNGQRQVVYANEAACSFFKRRHPAILGRRPGELLECENAADAPSGCGTGEPCRSCGAVLAILESQKGRKATYECRIFRRGEHGLAASDLRIHSRPFPWQGETFTIFVASDITSVKRKEVLERTFFHDVLNLAGGLEGLSMLLFDDPGGNSELKRELCSSATALMQEIRSHQMLLAAERAELALNPARFAARDLLLEVQNAFRKHPVAAQKGIEISRASLDFQLASDRTILGRILGNLVKNALEATPAGTQVTLSCQPERGGGVFSCHNPGCMPEHVQEQMFRRAFSTKGPGRGVGTYSVRLFVERYLKGRVAFRSTPEFGTVFEVSLPDLPISTE